MTRNMNVSEKTVRKIVRTDLKLSSLKIQTRQQLTDLRKEKKTGPAKIFLNKKKAIKDCE